MLQSNPQKRVINEIFDETDSIQISQILKDSENDHLLPTSSPISTILQNMEQQTLKQLKQYIDSLSTNEENNLEKSLKEPIQKQKYSPQQQQFLEHNQQQSQNSQDGSQSQNTKQIKQNFSQNIQHNQQKNHQKFYQKYFNNPNQNEYNHQQQIIQNSHESYFSLGQKNDQINNFSTVHSFEDRSLYSYYFQNSDDTLISKESKITNIDSYSQTKDLHNKTDNNNCQENQKVEEEQEICMEIECHSEQDYNRQQNLSVQQQDIQGQSQNSISQLAYSSSKQTQKLLSVTKIKKKRQTINPQQKQKKTRIKFGAIANEIFNLREVQSRQQFIQKLLKGHLLQKRFSEYNLQKGVKQINLHILQSQVTKLINNINKKEALEQKDKKYTHIKNNKNYILYIQYSHQNSDRAYLQLVQIKQ